MGTAPSLPDTMGILSPDPPTPLQRPENLGPQAQMTSSCDRSHGIVPFGEDCIDVETIIQAFEEVFPIFDAEIRVVAKDFPETLGAPDEPWDEPDPDLDEDEKLDITIPKRFIRHNKVGGELVAFMLAHEIGHGLGAASSCTDTYEQICEGYADHWAAAWGLSMVYPEEEYIRISKEAEKQIADYIDARGGDQVECGNRFCDCPVYHGCGHPPAACRAQTIKMGRWPTKKMPVCVDRWANDLDDDCGDCPDAQ
jgi:hypothetical protein